MKKLIGLTLAGLIMTVGCAAKNDVAHVDMDDTEDEVVELDYSKYKFERPGFVTKVVDNRLWVFKENDPELVKFVKDGELAKHVVLPSSGPKRVTIKAPNRETIDAYLAAYGDLDEVEVDWSKYNFSKPGFVTKVVEGRLWVFKAGDKNLAAFEKDGELAKHVIVPAGGPHGITVKAPDKQTIDEYMSAK